MGEKHSTLDTTSRMEIVKEGIEMAQDRNNWTCVGGIRNVPIGKI